MNLSFINNNGTLPKEHSSLISKYMKKTKGRLIEIIYKAIFPTRSIMQNAYYFGVIVKMLKNELGYPKKVMHNHLKKLFLGYEEYDMPDGITHYELKSTKDLSTIGAENYYANVRQWGFEFLNCYIPLPNETQYNYYEYEVKE